MQRAVSTYVCVKERLHPGLLDKFVRGGAQAIEIFASRGHFDYTSRAHINEIAAWFKSSGIVFHSLHAPLFSDTDWGRNNKPPLNLVDMDKRQRIESMDEIKRALEVAEILPFKFLVQHLGLPGESFSERKFEDALTAIEHLRAFAKPLGVTVLVENIPNELSEPDRLRELIRMGHFTDVGVCFDLGHAHMMGTVRRDGETLKELIRSTHVHDNRGERDAHLWPGQGTIAWKEAVAVLQSAPQVPPLLLEIDAEHVKDLSADIAIAFSKLEEAGARA